MELYWVLTLARLSDIAHVLAIIMGIASGIMTFLHFIALGDPFPEIIKIFKKLKWFFIILFLIFLTISVLCPSRTDLAIMCGWDALKSETAEEVFELVKERIR
jgi:uncharacterized membrane protein YbhN (UPF0104 family)